MNHTARLTAAQETSLAIAAAVVTANAYYIHPIIALVADHFGVSHARIGLVPALNQLALAVGIFLLLPLGDRFSNRRLTIAFATGQTVSLAVMTFAQGFTLFVLGSTLLGFFTIAPYLLPAYASKRVAPERLGQVTAKLTAGVILGILVARVGAGVVAEHFGWRAVYWAATGLMLAVTLALPRLMEGGERPASGRQSYTGLILSVFPLLSRHREILIAGAIQGLNFAQFIALWLGLALYLTSPPMGYGTDTVGYLAGLAAVSIASTPWLGRWSDAIGPRTARMVFASIQLVGILLLWPLGGTLWGLLVPLFIANLVGPGIDVTGRMTFLSLDPAIRTRLTTIYVVIMFIGGGIGSYAGTLAYDIYGWAGTCALLAGCSLALTALSFAARRYGR
ncbi:MFS transporter [Erythrobacter citreus]|uniref:MFS family arabinose efflux permease n=1 Tax=Qipengyuania citrea TaxID=225971 RepID=A0A6I4U9F0_9SPHN|nr:MFS transporter [Qipengyuania citrea]MDQ0565215.1 putative MFS family arabinose efflux permease [Qipengyuania citrea]MXP35771.1 MFS transporter [Qipengyuania citrea]